MEDFRPLKMAVRVDREGRLMRDYHTAQEVLRTSGKSTQDTVLSERFYLADADFLVGLEGGRSFLSELAMALEKPVWQLCLGRKSFIPALPVCEGLQDGDLLGVLQAAKWRKRWPREKPLDILRYVVEVDYGKGEPRQDVPISFVSRDRKFAVRHVITEFHPLSKDQILEIDAEVNPCS